MATSERILKGQGVDRPTLTIAFKNVGLDWDDSYCEPIACDHKDSAQQGPEDFANDLPEPRALKQSSGPVWLGSIAFAALALIVVYATGRANANGTGGATQSEPWGTEYVSCVSAADSAYHKADFEAAKRYVERAVQLATKHQNAGLLAEALRLSGDLACERGDFEDAKQNYEDALVMRRRLRQVVTFPSLWLAIGGMETKLGQYASARQHLELGLKAFQSMHDKTGVSMASRDLGTLFQQQGIASTAREWFEQALVAAKEGNKPDLVHDISARMAILMRNEGRLLEAKNALNGCLAYWTARQHPRWIAETQLQLSTVELSLGEKDQAIRWLRESKRAFARLGDQAGLAECDNRLLATSAPREVD